MGIGGALLGLPLVTLAVRSFDAGLRYYTALFENPRGSIFYVPPVAAVGNSVKFALATMALALLLGMLTATALYRRKQGWILDALFMLPLGTSAVTLGLGYLLAMAPPAAEPARYARVDRLRAHAGRAAVRRAQRAARVAIDPPVVA